MIVFIVGILLVGGIVAALVYFRYRKLLREAKNYERGLKMVSLVIHLPPSSDDLEMGSRDARDVTEETISKAQVLYNIIASTATKGFKSKFYGQRHISFEIVATKGLVHYYTAVPVAMVSVVRQAVVSAYPSATLEEVEEHNIFSPVGKISGTIGGELVLKENFAHPIATFSDTKRDAMQSILNAFSTLTNEDGAAIQMLLRPAKDGWTKQAQSVAQDKREGNDSGSSGFGGWLRQILEALWKPPESGEDGHKPESKPLTSLEQANIDAIEEKTRHPGYETLIRVVASSNTATRSQAVLNNMVASFALFDAPGKNGFKFVPAKDIERFVTSYIFRFFPPEVSATILNSVELATIFHLPEQRDTPTSQITRQASKQVDGPNNIAEDGMLLGYNVFRGVVKNIQLSQEDRRRHMYAVGQTGTGKSVFLENLAYQDMLDGRGFAFIDPHGDAVEKLISMVPKERVEDIIYFSPADMDYPLGLNLFEFSSPEQKDFLIQEAINMLYKLYDPQHTGIIGPRYEHWFRNAALTLMSDPAGSTFIEIPKIFTDNQFARAKQKHVTDPTVLDFWNKEMAKTTDYHKSEILGWFVSKFGAFLSNEMMRNIIGQTKSSFNLREVMDDKKILLVNLSKGRVGELNSKLLGMIFVMKFQAAAMSRADIPEDQRSDFSLYVDEFQNFSTDSFATILSEARKYRLNLIVANQFISQLSDEVRDAVFGNVGSVLTLRTGANDADFLVKQFSPVFGSEDLVKLPNYNAVVQLMVGGVPSQPFSMKTVEPLGNPKPQVGIALKKLSAAKYGRPRAEVEKEIFERLETKAAPAAARPIAAPGGAKRPPTSGAQQPKPSTKSFLDEWLEKRKKQKKAMPGAAPNSVNGVASQQAPPTPAPVATPQPAAPLPPARPIAPPPPVQQVPVPVASPVPAPALPPVPVEPQAPVPSIPAPPQAPAPAIAPDVKTPHLQADTTNVFTPTPGTVVGQKGDQPKVNAVEPSSAVSALPPQEVELPSGPTDFASQMGTLKKQMEEQKSALAGSRSDKDDVANIASVVKRNIKYQPDAVEEHTPTADEVEEEEVNEDEIYIDKDGQIHYGKDDAAPTERAEPKKEAADETSVQETSDKEEKSVDIDEPTEDTQAEKKGETEPDADKSIEESIKELKESEATEDKEPAEEIKPPEDHAKASVTALKIEEEPKPDPVAETNDNETLPEAPNETLPEAPNETLPEAPNETLPEAPKETHPEAPKDKEDSQTKQTTDAQKNPNNDPQKPQQEGQGSKNRNRRRRRRRGSGKPPVKPEAPKPNPSNN